MENKKSLVFIILIIFILPLGTRGLNAQVNIISSENIEGISSTFMRTIGVCFAVPKDLHSEENVINPEAQVVEYLRDSEQINVPLDSPTTLTILEWPTNGILHLITKKDARIYSDGKKLTNIGRYAYLPHKYFSGPDKVVLLVELQGAKIKVEYFLQSVKGTSLGFNGFAEACGNTDYRWKISNTIDSSPTKNLDHVRFTQASSSNLRANARSNAVAVKKLPINTEVYFIEKRADWALIQVSGKAPIRGWIHQSLLAKHPLTLEVALERYNEVPDGSLLRLKWIERASAIDPQNKNVLGELVKTLLLHKEYDRALEMVKARPELMVFYLNKDMRGFEKYFPQITGAPLYAPFGEIGTRLPKVDSDALAEKLGIGYLESAYYMAQGKIVIGDGVIGYVILDQSYSDETMLYIADAGTGTIYDQQILHEDSCDAGYCSRRESYFVDIDQDGYLDFISNETADGIDFEKWEKEKIEQYKCLEQTVSYFLFSKENLQFTKIKSIPYSIKAPHLSEFLKTIQGSCKLN